jgi:hypothetical protein
MPRGRWNDAGRRTEQAPVEQPRMQRGNWPEGRGQAPIRSSEQPRMEQRRMEQPRMEQQRSYQPSMQRSAPAPRMDAPSRSSGGGGFRGGRR